MRAGNLFLIGVICLGGCSTGEAPMYPVRGQVYYRNKPLAEALVVFHADDTNTKSVNKPMAYTDAQGNFTLTTQKASDGTTAGDYRITVELREAVLVGEEKVRTGRSLLPPRYKTPEKSGLSYRVQPGVNVVPKIELRD